MWLAIYSVRVVMMYSLVTVRKMLGLLRKVFKNINYSSGKFVGAVNSDIYNTTSSVELFGLHIT